MERKKRYLKRITASVLTGILFFLGRSVTAEEENRDYTDLQWYYNSETGISFPGWNTYDETGAPVHNVDPSKEIVVAVVDSGVDYTHEDLRNVMWDKGLEYPELTALGGGKYGISTVPWGDSTDPMDERGHGTHVAGIIAAEWNHIGVSGALSGVKIMAVKSTGDVTMPVIKGLEYVLAAKRAGVNIAAVNLSWNGNVMYSGPELLNKVVQELAEENVILVISAGNATLNLDNDVLFSSFQRSKPSVISVAASDQGGGLAYFSNYGPHYVDIAVPGDEILSSIPDLPEREDSFPQEEETEGEPGGSEPLTEGPAEEETKPFADKYYGYNSGTSMAAPIVTAEAAYLYSLYPNLSAEERAALLVRSSVLKSSFEGKLYGGLADVKAAASLSGWPYAADTEYDSDRGILTVCGYGFGEDTGSIQIDGTEYTPVSWSDQRITVRIKNLAMGEHRITVQTPQASKSRWLNVAAENEDLTIEPFDLLPVIPYSMTLVKDEIHVSGEEKDDGSAVGFYRLKKGASAFEKIGETSYFAPMSAAVWNGQVCYAYNGKLIMMDPDGKNMEKTEIRFPQEYVRNADIHAADDRLFVSWTGEDSFWIGECDADTKEAAQLLEIPDTGIRCIGLAEENDVITAALLNESEIEHIYIEVIRFAIGEESRETLFTVDTPDIDAFDNVKALFVNDRMYLGGIADHDADNTWNYSLSEYDLDGTEQMSERLGGGHLHRFSMAAGEKELVLFGSADAWKNNLFLLKRKTANPPTPTPTPTPAPRPKPSERPDPDEDEKPEDTPAPYYPVTCQDAGYPQGWYWDEKQQACVAPAPAASTYPPSSGGAPVYPPSGGPSYPSGSVPAVTPSSSPQSGSENTPQASITPIPAETPSASSLPQPPAAEEKTPAKRSLWFLAEPAVMILAGLAMVLSKNTKAIPWIVAADAVIGIAAAVLDHSVISWILLILNIAAVGLLGLYKGSQKD